MTQSLISQSIGTLEIGSINQTVIKDKLINKPCRQSINYNALGMT